ncbi:DUF4105 domain-containing protein [Ichthyenterobacterium sp. W332]|uniref:DUF4105 domain-containing protein n=1 Tax=Microcosmobacter mediterraneus TaxID=3075607 RepID=A0ABU2YI45_9FLAO|nr:DUF4105 domain-containing protein [Ichthyenterobacterium sp. W332]MDT0557369.1 DUF4105 domain-containing protein [Ichthyenterobacterium sp. W332]
MKQKLLFLLLSFFIYKSNLAQQLQLSEFAEISVLTIGPGDILNDAFGHSAFRVKDPMFRLDIVYNYGVYDFQTPNFYLKFAQGKLNYLIGLDPFDKFYANYKNQDRTINQQKLNLTKEQRQQLFDILRVNHLPENRRYLYDFFYDNCATKIRDVVNNATNNLVEFNAPKDLEHKTFRQLIYDHVDKNSWGSLGIDIALGSVIDIEAKPNEYMFLPKYIHTFFANATLASGEALVSSTKVLYEENVRPTKQSFLSSPMFILNIIAWIIIILTIRDYKLKKRSKWLDALIFLITGAIGISVLLLWFATDHSATANNYNLLWAFPFNLILVWVLLKKNIKKWVLGFIKFLVIMLCLLSLHWLLGVQVYALALIPILLALCIRYIYLIYYLKA